MNSGTKGDGLHMTSAEGGGVDYPKSRQKNGRSTVTRGERGQNPLFLANVICEWLHRRGGRVKEGRSLCVIYDMDMCGGGFGGRRTERARFQVPQYFLVSRPIAAAAR